jgi:class 3 adenylate cyclase
MTDKPNILIVDDRPENITALCSILEEFEANIFTATRGNDALELALKNDMAVILMDVQMPGMDGYETAEILRSRNNTPIIFVTATAKTQNNIFKGYESGAVDYMFKPVSPHALKSKVKVFVDLDRQKKELEVLNLTLENRVEERTRELEKTNEALQRFVPHEFIHLLHRESIGEVKAGDHIRKKMTILFADIRSFTVLSEQMNPEENFKFINSYLSFMAPAIFDNNGFIDKYIGDAIMALFENANDAVNAAITMFQTLRTYNGYRRKVNYIPINIGVGINTGELILGTIGGKVRMDSTVIGDTVNLASAIEQLTKIYQSPVLIGPETFLSLSESFKFNLRYIDCVRLKGKAKEVMIYEVLDAESPESSAKKIDSLRVFEHALLRFQSGEYEQAQTLFQECFINNPFDKAAQIYLERCQAETQSDEKPMIPESRPVAI